MHLLVTNTQTPQAYAIIRALRPHAARVVATMEGEGPLARLAHAARSRLVNARYQVPAAVADWSHGRIGPENTDAEEQYVRALLDVCRAERIDVVYPSWDPYVYVLAKNKARLAEAGVTVPVPDLETVLTALDKHATVEAGQAVGFPCPGSVLYRGPADVADAEARWGYPLVVKPRFTSGGQGMAIVATRAELDAALPPLLARHGAPLIQEYIPGGRRDSVQFVLGHDGDVLFAFHKRRLRTFRRTARFGTVSESASPDARRLASAALLQRIGWWGALGIETIHDPRDGQHKLMEINPRFPRQLWNRTGLGVNEPLMCVKLARGEPVEAVETCEPGVLFVSPVEDVQLLGVQLLDMAAFRLRQLAHRRPIDASTRPPRLLELLRSFADTYTRPARRIWDPYVRQCLRDPVVAVLWWLQFSTWLAGSWRQWGR